MISNKLIFANAFDGRVHVDFTKIPSVGTKFVGPLQLLAELGFYKEAPTTNGEIVDDMILFYPLQGEISIIQ